MIQKRASVWPAVGVLLGTVIGAGLFSLPYVFKSAGLPVGFFYLVLAAAVYIPIHRMYAAVIHETPGEHRFVGYARIHLGRAAALLTVFISVIQSVLVLAIYLILSKSFANLVWPAGAEFHKIAIFWVLGSAAVFLNLRRFSLLESLIVGGIFGIIIAIFFLGLPKLPATLAAVGSPDWHYALLPIGSVLFALYGRSAIPPAVRLTEKTGKAIAIGITAAAVIYAFFVLAVLSLSPAVSPDAVSGLRGHVPVWALFGIGILGLLSLFSSYISIGQDTSESLRLDFKLSVWTRFLIVIFGPLALYLAGFTNFIGLVSFVGGVLLAMEGILIVLMWRKVTGRKLNLGSVLIIFVFIASIIYEILK